MPRTPATAPNPPPPAHRGPGIDGGGELAVEVVPEAAGAELPGRRWGERGRRGGGNPLHAMRGGDCPLLGRREGEPNGRGRGGGGEMAFRLDLDRTPPIKMLSEEDIVVGRDLRRARDSEWFWAEGDEKPHGPISQWNVPSATEIRETLPREGPAAGGRKGPWRET